MTIEFQIISIHTLYRVKKFPAAFRSYLVVLKILNLFKLSIIKHQSHIQKVKTIITYKGREVLL